LCHTTLYGNIAADGVQAQPAPEPADVAEPVAEDVEHIIPR